MPRAASPRTANRSFRASTRKSLGIARRACGGGVTFRSKPVEVGRIAQTDRRSKRVMGDDGERSLARLLPLRRRQRVGSRDRRLSLREVNMVPVHPGRILKRELEARGLSANVWRWLCACLRADHRHPQRQAGNLGGDGAEARPLFRQQRAILDESADRLSSWHGGARNRRSRQRRGHARRSLKAPAVFAATPVSFQSRQSRVVRSRNMGNQAMTAPKELRVSKDRRTLTVIFPDHAPLVCRRSCCGCCRLRPKCRAIRRSSA